MEYAAPLHSKILNFKTLVAYSPGSIVSKSIMDDKAGRITLFAFDKGEKLSPHTTPFDALIQIVEGEGEIIIADKSFMVKEGESIIMPKSIMHAVNAHQQFKMLLTLIKSKQD
ncbi:MAG: cupin domain-containing protein [Bacteroidales bacterium]|nr:cupin domain-containing protein [Bacteroidales bacterium]